MITGNTRSTGPGICLNYGKVEVVHCTIYGNKATSNYPAFEVNNHSIISLKIINSILWNPGNGANELPVNVANITVENSIIRGGAYGMEDDDPLLHPKGYLRAGSPAIDAGIAGGVPRDFQNETRNLPDIGADEFVDSDADGLPDWVEALGAQSPTGDADGDGLENLWEYAVLGTDPNLYDTDGDGLNDLVEGSLGTDPLDTDSDADEMSDGYEVACGLDPLDASDRLLDKDKDRFPNVAEALKGSFADDPESIPDYDYVVDPVEGPLSGSDNIYATIPEAVNKCPSDPYLRPLSIIFVKSGTYQGKIGLLGWRTLVLIAEQSGEGVTLRGSSNNDRVFTVHESNVVMDGFRITRYPWNPGGAMQFYDGDFRVINCEISGHRGSYPAGANVSNANATFLNCTFWDNDGWTQPNSLITSNAEVHLENCILWGSNASNPEVSGANITQASSIIRGGGPGRIGCGSASGSLWTPARRLPGNQCGQRIVAVDGYSGSIARGQRGHWRRRICGQR